VPPHGRSQPHNQAAKQSKLLFFTVSKLGIGKRSAPDPRREEKGPFFMLSLQLQATLSQARHALRSPVASPSIFGGRAFAAPHSLCHVSPRLLIPRLFVAIAAPRAL